jgi:protein-S-isoprenylcysteine O-methyltransferase Ste14
MNLSMPPAILPVLLLVALGLAFALQNRRTAARVGRSPNRFGANETAHDFVGRVYRIGGAILLLFMIARMAAPGIDNAVGRVPGLALPLIAWTGMGSLAAGGAVILIAQAQMGTSWRIGLDPERTGLVTSGLFAWSRNPTFFGMMLVVSGAFLVVPTIVTCAVLTAAWIAFSVQIRMEEEHLTRMHGAYYERYRTSVSRWIGLSETLNGASVRRPRPVNHG